MSKETAKLYKLCRIVEVLEYCDVIASSQAEAKRVAQPMRHYRKTPKQWQVMK